MTQTHTDDLVKKGLIILERGLFNEAKVALETAYEEEEKAGRAPSDHKGIVLLVSKLMAIVVLTESKQKNPAGFKKLHNFLKEMSEQACLAVTV